MIAPGNGVIEMGAQFCHGRNNIVYQLANPAGLLHTEFQTEESTGWATNVQMIYWKTGQALNATQVAQYRTAADSIYDTADSTIVDGNPISIGTFFNQQL